MSIFQDEKENDLKKSRKSDLFTVVDEEESKIKEDLGGASETEEIEEASEDEPVKEPENTIAEIAETENFIPAEHSKILENAAPDTESVTVITKGTTINGSIISDCSLDVCGTIIGDIECLGKLTISGRVTGNSLAAEVYVNTSRLEGNITSEGSVKIGNNTVVIGDIAAASAVIAGAVKGEIDVKGPVVFDSTAVVKGNVKAKSVQMNNGALLEGFCSLAYAEVEIESMFE